MPYLELKFFPVNSEEQQSLLIAGLLVAGFESFTEEEDAVLAYISTDKYNENLLDGIIFHRDHPDVKVEVKPLEDINWNKAWESNYEPVTIAGKCHVRAPFHPRLKNIRFEIIIEPKMAFGTAHHETTRLMAEWLMDLRVKGKDVLDMGCGTGVLAILANKMGAAAVKGIDNDEWAWRNARENFTINGLQEENVSLGDATVIQIDSFDLVLANINRNVLLQDMKAYYDGLRNGGKLLLSGFYQKDIPVIRETAEKLGMEFLGSRNLNDWAVVLLQKRNG
jgi:ribosomal protein L11 methyltransferase